MKGVLIMSMMRKVPKFHDIWSKQLLLTLIASFFVLSYSSTATDLTPAPLNQEFLDQSKDDKMCSTVGSGPDAHSLGLSASPVSYKHMSGLGSAVTFSGINNSETPQNKYNVVIPIGQTTKTKSSNYDSDNGSRISSGSPVPAEERPSDESVTNYASDRIEGSSGTNGLPASYDLRTLGRTPPVKDQGSCGCCWAFATLEATISNILGPEGKGKLYDFSAQHLNVFHGFCSEPCAGGYELMAIGYLARWRGPVSTDDVPYEPYETPFKDSAAVLKHVQEILLLPDRGDIKDNKGIITTNYYEDNDCIKKAIMEYGALYIAISAAPIFSRDSSGNQIYYNKDKSAYYSDTIRPDHAVLVVGWDDNYSIDNFNEPNRPKGPGAFIIQNSWGTGFGEDGYFYASYYNRSLKRVMAIAVTEDIDKYTKKYEYDTIGLVGHCGYENESAYFANIYAIDGDNRYIYAVSFYTPTVDCTYEIWVYDGVTNSPDTGTMAKHIEPASIECAGYHTIKFPEKCEISGGKFSVVVKLKSPKYNFPVSLEYNYAGVCEKSTPAGKGQSFVKGPEQGNKWEDMVDKEGEFKNGNVCLKAFARRD